MTTERFEFREELGRGGGGKVIRAFDRERGVDVALKRLHAASSAHEAALRQEHRLLQGVNHPCIVTPLELGRDSDGLFLVSAFVPGQDFVTHCKGSWLRLGTVVPQLLSVLRYLHSRGLAHGDISPNNVRVRPNGQVGVIDFGLAGRVDSNGRGGGTPGFIAPERVRGGATAQSDLFALGALLAACVPDDTLEPVLQALRGPAGSRPNAAQLETTLLPRLGSIPLPLAKETHRTGLVGRSLLLGRLRGAVLAGRSVVLEGPSAIGKTSLLDALVESFDEMTVLRARPRPGSRVPFEALDQLLACVPSPLSVDAAVSARLGRHSPAVANWVGQSSHALRTRADIHSRLFGQQSEPSVADDVQAILQGLQRPVLVVDDMQWADSDSLECLEALVHDQVVVAGTRPGTNGLSIRTTPVPPLRLDAMHALLSARGVSDAAAADIAASSAGVPGVALFAARFSDGARALHVAVAHRIAEFQETERSVLANLVVAGRPVDRDTLSAAGLESLVREGFIVERDSLIDIAHDVLRAPIETALGEDWLRTARLQRATEPDVPTTARVDAYLALGDHGRAAELAHVAAEEAMALGAFHAAAELWGTAAKTDPALRSRWGEACVAAGRHDEAAMVWHELIRESTGSERRKYQLARAHALLAGRRIDEGKAALQEALGRSEPTWKTVARFLSGPRQESPRLDAEGAELALRNAALVGYLDSLEGVRLALDARSGFGAGSEELGAWADSLLSFFARFAGLPRVAERYRVAATQWGSGSERPIVAAFPGFLRGYDALRTGRPKLAVTTFDDALRSVEGTADARSFEVQLVLSLRTSMVLKSQRIEPIRAAIARFETATQRSSGSALHIHVETAHALCLTWQGRYEEAVERLAQARREWPSQTRTVQQVLIEAYAAWPRALLGDACAAHDDLEAVLKGRRLLQRSAYGPILLAFSAATELAACRSGHPTASRMRALRRAWSASRRRSLANGLARRVVAEITGRGLKEAEQAAWQDDQPIDRALAHHARALRVGGTRGVQMRADARRWLAEVHASPRLLEEFRNS